MGQRARLKRERGERRRHEAWLLTPAGRIATDLLNDLHSGPMTGRIVGLAERIAA